MKSAMGLAFKSQQETPYGHKDDCQMPLVYKKGKEVNIFIKESFRVKKEALQKRVFFHMYGKGVKVSGVCQI